MFRGLISAVLRERAAIEEKERAEQRAKCDKKNDAIDDDNNSDDENDNEKDDEDDEEYDEGHDVLDADENKRRNKSATAAAKNLATVSARSYHPMAVVEENPFDKTLSELLKKLSQCLVLTLSHDWSGNQVVDAFLSLNFGMDVRFIIIIIIINFINYVVIIIFIF